MPEITIYHNGSCSKSGGALEILQQQCIPHNIRWYLADPLSKEELIILLQKLGIAPSRLVRKSEELYTNEYEHKNISEEEWLDIFVEHPELIQRPIVEQGDKAVIARPPERIFEFINTPNR